MRIPLLVSLLFLFSTLSSKSQDLAYTNTSRVGPIKGNQIVYICTGAYAYSYHSNANCAGLGNCKASIGYIDENTAYYNYKRRPCCRCWSNNSNDCKDDLVGGGGNGGGGGG